ncbi:DUF2971 domain-containing protein [Grimontia hollisae]|uniref:DUF2971 domain-containing protein n=1 Tax=Grimontia hollisae TaxID=673 RepID=UPI0013037B05|nr:DUF2971 domain-containing protein [Grimontia hollisae]
MEFPEVKRLYKFRTLRSGVDEDGKPIYNQFTISMLREKTAWIARPDTFNDPFDCNYRPIPARMKEGDELFIDDLPPHEVEAKIINDLPKGCSDREMEQAIFRIAEFRNDHIQHMINSYCVLSLSEECDHTLLWSHYADQHRGICIQYARSENSNLSGELSRPVRYRRHYYSVDHKDYQVFLRDHVYSPSGKDWRNGNNLLTNAIFTKSEQWFYEKEWRIAMPFPQPAKGFNLKIDVPIISVIFGCLTPEEDKKVVMDILGDDVRYYQAWKSKMEHKLDVIPEEEWRGRMDYYQSERDISKYLK